MYKYSISQFSYFDYDSIEVLHPTKFTEKEFIHILLQAKTLIGDDINYTNLSKKLVEEFGFENVTVPIIEINLGDSIYGEIPEPTKPKPLF